MGDHLWLLLALAFPAVLINIGHGQNGFLSAALVGGALVVLDRRPIAAGILFGLLVYKPQYGLLIPLVLMVNGRWKCFSSAAVTVALLTLATTLAFGIDVWRAFLASTEFTRTVVLEQGNTGWYKIQSVFAWARMWGAPIPLAYALQGTAILGIGAALVWLWRSTAPYRLKAAAFCLATILAKPYSFDYDMMVLAPAIAFIGRWFHPQLRAVGENHARGIVAHAACRPQCRSSQSSSTWRSGHAAGDFWSHIAAQRIWFGSGIL